MKQTAVEWLYTKLSTCTSEELVGNINKWFEQAKEMEKENLSDSFIAGGRSKNDFSISKGKEFQTFEQHYNETYNK